MPDDGSSQSRALWPLPKFRFQVLWEGSAMFFQEVSGLDSESQPIEYRHGDSTLFSTTKLPGLRKFGNVTLKRAVFQSDNKFWDWLKDIKTDTLKPAQITITLLDEENKPTMLWMLHNARPTKIAGTDIKVQGNEVAIETIELIYESLETKTA